MFPTIIIAFTSIFLLYFFFAFTKKLWVRLLFNINVCPICMAVGITWLWLLIARNFGLFEVENIALAVLFGNTVIGMMWKLEDYYKRNGFHKWYIVRLVYIAGGEFLAYGAAVRDAQFMISGALLLLVAIIFFFFFSNHSPSEFWKNITTRADNKSKKVISNNAKKSGGEKKENKEALSKMDEMFDECC